MTQWALRAVKESCETMVSAHLRKPSAYLWYDLEEEVDALAVDEAAHDDEGH